jgi:hypothetical protein
MARGIGFGQREKAGWVKEHNLEDYRPGATKEEVLATLSRVARTPKPPEEDSKKPEK